MQYILIQYKFNDKKRIETLKGNEAKFNHNQNDRRTNLGKA